MDDVRLGIALKAARVGRRLRQSDLARRAGVSPSLISRLEHGNVDRLSLRALRSIAAKLGVSLEIVPRSAGGELDRMANARHAAMGEQVASWIARQPGWIVAAEASFSIYGERGTVDLLARHEISLSVVVIELKTAIVDVNELVGTLDRKRRLAPRIASDRGWRCGPVSTWLVVADSKTNRRRVSEHRHLLTSALPNDGRSFGPLLRHPDRAPESGIAFWPTLPGVKVGDQIVAPRRVTRPRQITLDTRSRSEAGTGHASARL
jgi:transcriptional regulator with XRE-family HTH domain